MRFKSHLKQLIRKGNLPITSSNEIDMKMVKAYLKDFPELIEFGLYYKYIDKWYNVFKSSDILLVNYEDIKVRPGYVLNKVFTFLGVNCDYRPKTINQIVSKGIIPKNKFFEKLRIKAYNYFFYKNPGVINLIKLTRISDFYRKLNQSKNTILKFTPEAEEYLNALFDEDWTNTHKLLNTD